MVTHSLHFDQVCFFFSCLLLLQRDAFFAEGWEPHVCVGMRINIYSAVKTHWFSKVTVNGFPLRSMASLAMSSWPTSFQ